jgi:ribosomal protein S18 acetylase RimI-like enzyme
MQAEYEQFIKLAKKNLGYFCFMVWDYYKFPNFFRVKIIDDTLLCLYEKYVLIYGNPNEKILEDFDLKEQIFVTFKPEWLSLLQKNFTDFELIVDIAEETEINKFLCMELLEENFTPKNQYKSRKFSREDMELLEIKRRIHQSRGFGGVGIVRDNNLIGCAFASQVVKESPFSFAAIRDVWVHPDFRRQGLGADLTTHIAEIIFDNKIERVFLWVEERNYSAVRLYEKLGFKTIDTFLSTVCKLKKKD